MDPCVSATTTKQTWQSCLLAAGSVHVRSYSVSRRPKNCASRRTNETADWICDADGCQTPANTTNCLSSSPQHQQPVLRQRQFMWYFVSVAQTTYRSAHNKWTSPQKCPLSYRSYVSMAGKKAALWLWLWVWQGTIGLSLLSVHFWLQQISRGDGGTARRKILFWMWKILPFGEVPPGSQIRNLPTPVWWVLCFANALVRLYFNHKLL